MADKTLRPFFPYTCELNEPENTNVIPMRITVNIKEQRVKDLLTSALEGGSNYWYMIRKNNYPKGQTKESLGIKFAHVDLPFVEGGSLTIVDAEDEDSAEWTLDYKAILRGLHVMARKYPADFNNWREENDDAFTGDTFLQCCLFGSVIYG